MSQTFGQVRFQGPDLSRFGSCDGVQRRLRLHIVGAQSFDTRIAKGTETPDTVKRPRSDAD
jgi:hypothetical protein